MWWIECCWRILVCSVGVCMRKLATFLWFFSSVSMFLLQSVWSLPLLILYLQSQASGNVVRSIQSGVSSSRERRIRLGMFFVICDFSVHCWPTYCNSDMYSTAFSYGWSKCSSRFSLTVQIFFFKLLLKNFGFNNWLGGVLINHWPLRD